MNYEDPEDEKKPEVQLSRTFTFRGKPLASYSFNHRDALFRLGTLTDYAYCTYLVRILLMSERDVDAIRTPEQISDFRIEAGKWADREKISSGAGLDEVQKLVDEIIAAVDSAEAIQPAPVKKNQADESSPQAPPVAT